MHHLSTLQPRERPSRLALAALAALTCAAVTTACTVGPPGLYDTGPVIGFDPVGSSDHPLLRGGDLGPGYRSDPGPGGEQDLTREGCLSALRALAAEADGQTEANFTTEDPRDSLLVRHTVLDFADVAGAGHAVSSWAVAAPACDGAEVLQRGSTLRLKVTTDTERYGSAVAEEVNVVATGEIDSDSIDVRVHQWVSVARVEDHVSVVHVLDLDHNDAIDEGRRVARLTAERLAAWLGRQNPGPGGS